MPGSTDMAVVPSIATAPLPARYEQAKAALAECDQVDECKDWADKAQALASYARQADDDALFRLARRIQARAIRRAGDLLKTFQDTERQVARDVRDGQTVGTHPLTPRTQREAAEAAGLSEHQEKTAVRVSNVPEEEFEAAVESEDPPTVTALAERGKQGRPAATPPSDDPVFQPKPEGFNESIHTLGDMRRFAEKCREHSPDLIANGMGHYNHDEALSLAGEITSWLERFVPLIRSKAA